MYKFTAVYVSKGLPITVSWMSIIGHYKKTISHDPLAREIQPETRLVKRNPLQLLTGSTQ